MKMWSQMTNFEKVEILDTIIITTAFGIYNPKTKKTEYEDRIETVTVYEKRDLSKTDNCIITADKRINASWLNRQRITFIFDAQLYEEYKRLSAKYSLSIDEATRRDYLYEKLNLEEEY